MKKLIIMVLLSLIVVLGIVGIKSVSAEEQQEVIDSNAQVVEEVKEPTIDEFKMEVEEWLSQYMEESLVAKIITWLVDAGVLGALFAVFLKYSKYKNTTLDDLLKGFNEKMEGWLKEKADELSIEQVDKIKESIEKLKESNETIMKVLILMQDNTAKGKIALVDYLGMKTNSEDAKEVKETLEKQEEVKKEVNEKVSSDYENIF